MKSDRIAFSCQTFGYDITTEQDVELPSIYITVWVSEGSTGKALELECKTPDELWQFIRDMAKDRMKTLRQTFNYLEPVRKSGLPINLGDLFK